MKGQYWAYRDRKTRKRTFRYLWIQRLNAAARANGISYSRFAEGLKAAGIGLDRKILSDLAVTDEAAFKSIVDQAKSALADKSIERQIPAEADTCSRHCSITWRDELSSDASGTAVAWLKIIIAYTLASRLTSGDSLRSSPRAGCWLRQ